MSYNTIARNLKQMSEYRYKVILFYKGLVFDNKGNLNEQFVKTRFVFMKTLYELYVNHF